MKNLNSSNISIKELNSIDEFENWKTKNYIIHDIKILPDGDSGEHSFPKIKIFVIYSILPEVQPY